LNDHRAAQSKEDIQNPNSLLEKRMKSECMTKGKDAHSKAVKSYISTQRILKENIRKYQEPILEFGPTGNIPYLMDSSQLFRVEKKEMIVNPTWSQRLLYGGSATILCDDYWSPHLLKKDAEKDK